MREPRASRADAARAARRASTSACCCPTRSAPRSRPVRGAASPSAGATRPTAAAPLLTRARARARRGPGPQPGVLLSGDARGPRTRACRPPPDASLALPGRVGASAGARSSASPGPGSASTRRRLRHRQALAARALRRGRRRARAAHAARRSRSSARAAERAARPRRSPPRMRGAAPASCAARRRSPSWWACWRALRLLLTNDSGPMHLAAALGHAAGGGLRPDRLARDGARRGARHRLVREPVHCAPCMLRECPIDHRCMRARRGRARGRGAALELLAPHEQAARHLHGPRRHALARGRLRQPPLALPALPLGGGRGAARSTAPAGSRSW